MKTFLATATTALLVSTALAGPMPSGKPPGGAPDTATPNPEALFVPIAPCRAFSGQQLNVNIPRHFVISGPTGACGVPASATAVTISLSSSSSSGNGSVTAYPFGATPGSTRALTFNSSIDLTAAVTVGLGSNAIALRANSSSTKIAGDVTGYYAPQIEAYVSWDGSIQSRTARILGVTHDDIGMFTVEVDRDVSECAIQLTPGTGGVANATVTGSELHVATNAITDLSAHDVDFYISVNC